MYEDSLMECRSRSLLHFCPSREKRIYKQFTIHLNLKVNLVHHNYLFMPFILQETFLSA